MDSIAIVGLDCAFPGAPGGDAYWDLLMRGGDAVGDIPEQRWDPRDYAAREPGAVHSDMTRGGFIDDVDAFDNDFFSVAPREAAAMDPQHRLLLQCAWRALEDSGQAPGALAGTDAGVFVGVMGGEWGRLRMGDYTEITPQLGAGSSAGMTANRISYHLNLTGPSLAVDTACSSSLVAVHLAANALLSGECDTALAGGVNLVLSPALGIVYTQLGLASSDGRCRPFSADADGIARSDGVGLVVLRRTADALADGQRIYAVIRGTAVNQDGRSNGVTAPNRWSQQKVVEAAYRRAGVTPEQVSFIEAHGTGTVLGDAIECAALGTVHAVPRDEPCAIGSVKGNLGHTEGAAGIAGLIKAALALHHRIVPASRFADRENPQLRLAERGLRLLKSPLRLPPGEAVAGVSSFGMGGTNAHAVLATAPRTRTKTAGRRDAASGAAGVFTLTGDTPEALRRNLADQAEAVAKRPRGEAAALCWSSNRIKTGLPFRFAVTARDTAELAAGLRQAAGQDAPAGVAHRPWSRPVVAFLFTGQGSQFPAMTAGLHRDSAVYRHFLDEADAALAPHTGGSVRDLILGGEQRIHETGNAQPALFAVGYALARTLTELGIQPAAVLGHSIGEYPAAVLAGVLSLDEAARLVAVRGALMQELPAGGGMLAVNASPADLKNLLDDEPQVGLGAVNGPADVVLSGAAKPLERIAEILRSRGVRTRPVPVSHAFHSALMAPALARFAETAGTVAAAPPQVPLASTRYGRMLRDEPMDGAYWTGQAAEPVLFASALGALNEAMAPTHLIEIGPKPQLLPLAGRAGLRGDIQFLHPAPGADASGRDLAELVAALYRAGLDPEWDALYAPRQRTAERLRPYVFSDRHRFWNKPAEPSASERTERTAKRPVRPVEPVLALGPPAALPAEYAESADTPPARIDALSQERDPVLCAVIEAVAEVGGYPLEQVVTSARFYEDLGFDSVMIMQLKDRIEARLSSAGEISVQQLLPALRSVGSLAEFLTECVSVRTP